MLLHLLQAAKLREQVAEQQVEERRLVAQLREELGAARQEAKEKLQENRKLQERLEEQERHLAEGEQERSRLLEERREAEQGRRQAEHDLGQREAQKVVVEKQLARRGEEITELREQLGERQKLFEKERQR